MRCVADFRIRLLATVIAGIWVLIGAWWFYRGLLSHPHAIFYAYTGVVVLLWQFPSLVFFLALHTRHFQQITLNLLARTDRTSIKVTAVQ